MLETRRPRALVFLSPFLLIIIAMIIIDPIGSFIAFALLGVGFGIPLFLVFGMEWVTSGKEEA